MTKIIDKVKFDKLFDELFKKKEISSVFLNEPSTVEKLLDDLNLSFSYICNFIDYDSEKKIEVILPRIKVDNFVFFHSACITNNFKPGNTKDKIYEQFCQFEELARKIKTKIKKV